MISIVICSANADDLKQVSQNIDQTIGVPYEIISYDNSEGRKGICELYNAGKKASKFNTLCFMHEDVEIRTQNWGQKVLDLFTGDKQIGVIGVAGGGYKALAPSGWYCLEYNSPDRSFQNVVQGFKLDSRDDFHAYHNAYSDVLSEVVAVDGLWFCARKEILADKPFDEDLLKGFHGYDIDFCLSLYGKYKIVVTYDILMKHASEGNFNKQWLDEILKVHRKWNRYLPLTVSKNVSETDIYLTEKRAVKNVIEQMFDWGYSFQAIQRMLIAGTRSKRMPLRLFVKGYVHLVEQYYERKRD